MARSEALAVSDLWERAQITIGTQRNSGRGLLVSGHYFDVLGLRPAVGRLIGPQDEPRIGDSDGAVLSYDYWQSRFGADPAIVGELITVNNRALTVVGVAMLYAFAGDDDLVVLLVIAIVVPAAAYLPARRASKLQPMQALRYAAPE